MPKLRVHQINRNVTSIFAIVRVRVCVCVCVCVSVCVRERERERCKRLKKSIATYPNSNFVRKKT